MSDTKRKVNEITSELPTVQDIWKAIHGVRDNTDLLVNYLLPSEQTGGKGKIAEIEEDIKVNSDWREKVTKRHNMVIGGVIVVQFIFGLILLFVKA